MMDKMYTMKESNDIQRWRLTSPWSVAVKIFAASVILAFIVSSASRNHDNRTSIEQPQSLRRNNNGEGRLLQNNAAVEEYQMNVLLHFSLEYANGTLASQLETKDPSNDAVFHLCDAVNEQVSYL